MEDIQKIRAKSVVKDKFWILQQNNVKIGQVKALANNDIEVNIQGRTKRYNSIAEMKESGLFEFMELPKSITDPTNEVEGFPSDGLAYNALWNVQYKLPLFTKSQDSKSWHAAGYYKVYLNNTWIVQYCPKLITLQRNDYEGPFKTDPGINQFSAMFE